jgi:hypothetical protein
VSHACALKRLVKRSSMKGATIQASLYYTREGGQYCLV